MSLFDEIEKKTYPKVQILDVQSFSFIKKNLENYCKDHLDKKLQSLNDTKYRQLYKQFLVQTKISKDQIHEHLLNKELTESIHGVDHSMRVSFLSWLISKRIEIDKGSQKSLIIAALMHDIRRKNDNSDHLHSLRASKYIYTAGKHISKNFGNFDKEVVSRLCLHHDTEQPYLNNSTYSTCLHIIKLADTLDRIRQPKKSWWPNFEMCKIKPTSLEIEMSVCAFLNDYEFLNKKTS